MSIARLQKQKLAWLSVVALSVAMVVVGFGCGGGSTPPMVTTGTGSVVVTLSDPPSCAAPSGAAKIPDGSFSNVWITIRSIQAHISATADDNSPGWQELAPQLNSAPAQVDLLHLPAQGQCLLEHLGSASLPAGDYQQIRLILLANASPSGSAPANNACASLGSVFNCVVDGAGTHTLNLSSEANTGLKIPPGQVMGGPIHVAEGQSVDLNIDFNTCASILKEGNGEFRLKPTLTAGVVSANMTGISGQIVDSVTSQPVAGAMVTLQFADQSGTDRIAMQELTDSTGHFGFCPLPVGAVFDVVADAITSSGTAYNATVIFNVTGGSNLGPVPLVEETPAVASASTGPGTIQGTITAINGTTGASIDATVSALQTAMVSGVNRAFTVPLFSGSNAAVVVNSSSSCPVGSPMGAFCAGYSLIVPASNPNVGTFSAGKVTFVAPAVGPILYAVEADAINPASSATICSPPSHTTNQDMNGQPLAVVAGATSNAARIDFNGCS